MKRILAIVCLLVCVVALQVSAKEKVHYIAKDKQDMKLKVEELRKQTLDRSMIAGDDNSRLYVICVNAPGTAPWLVSWKRTNKRMDADILLIAMIKRQREAFGGIQELRFFWIPGPPLLK